MTTVLAGVDGSPNSTRALSWAIEHASTTSDEVTAVHAFYIPSMVFSTAEFMPPEQMDPDRQAKAIFDAAVETIGGTGAAKVSLRVIEGYPPEVLAKATEQPDVAMVVIGARGHGKLDELFLGSVGHSLTHRCHKPLVIVPPKWTTGDGRVVVGFNGSLESLPALRWAADYCQRRSATLDAVTVYHGSGADKHEENAMAALAEAIEQIDTSGITVTAEAVDGHPAEVLLTRAQGADLLTVGTRGRGAWVEAITGSVTHACAEHSPAPVAIIRD